MGFHGLSAFQHYYPLLALNLVFFVGVPETVKKALTPVGISLVK